MSNAAFFFMGDLHWALSVYVLWIVQIACELALFGLLSWLFTAPPRVRWFFLFCAVAGISKMLIHDRLTYFYVGWTFQMIESCWLTWLAGQLCLWFQPKLKRWAYLPFASVLVMACYNFPPYTTPQMVEYTANSLLVCALTILLGIILAINDGKVMKLAAAIAFMACLQEGLARLHGHLAYLLWAKGWMAAWLVGLLAVGIAAIEGARRPRTPLIYAAYPKAAASGK